MKAAISRLGDAMLSAVLPSAEAGACCGVTWCTQYYFTCFCACTTRNGRC